MWSVSVIPGSGPFILDGGEIAVLMIHGFTGSPISVRPWADSLHRAGFTVAVPRLPGHGLTWSEMNETTWQEWFAEVDQNFLALKQRHKRVFVAGFSMGGSLALYLAARRSRELEGLLLVNPSISDDRFFMKFVPILKYFIPSLGGRGTDVAAPNPPRHSYGRTPLKALHSLQRLWREVQKSLHLVEAPLFIGYSINDHVVDPKNSELVIDGVASVDIREVIFERSFHNVALDHDLPILAQESIKFIQEVLSGELSRDSDESLIDAEFDSIVAGLDLDQSAPTSFLDELENFDAMEKYPGDNKELPTLTPIQRGALVGTTLGPAYALLIGMTDFDPFGLGYWPGLIALALGVATFFWQLRPESEDGDGTAV